MTVLHFMRIIPWHPMNTSNSIYQKRSSISHLAMGVMKMPRVSMYWEDGMDVGIFYNTMPVTDASNFGHVWIWSIFFFKVRLLYLAIRSRCLELPLEENLCIDEQMVPFHGTLSVKQHVKGIAHPWGWKYTSYVVKVAWPTTSRHKALQWSYHNSTRSSLDLALYHLMYSHLLCSCACLDCLIPLSLLTRLPLLIVIRSLLFPTHTLIHLSSFCACSVHRDSKPLLWLPKPNLLAAESQRLGPQVHRFVTC